MQRRKSKNNINEQEKQTRPEEVASPPDSDSLDVNITEEELKKLSEIRKILLQQENLISSLESAGKDFSSLIEETRRLSEILKAGIAALVAKNGEFGKRVKALDKVNFSGSTSPISRLEQTDEETGDAWDVLESMIGTYNGPADWSTQHDHYLHGSPKREEAEL